MLKAIGFDLDDTLYSRKDLYRPVYHRMQASIVKLKVDFDTYYDMYETYSNEEYLKFIRQEKSKERYQYDRVIRAYQAMGVLIDESEAIIFNALRQYYEKDLALREGVEVLFESLLEAGYELFVLTNGPSDIQRRKLRQLNIKQWIPENRWFISGEMATTKPDALIYQKITEGLALEPSEILCVGDNYINDVQAPKDFGWHTRYYNVHGESHRDAEEITYLTDIVSVAHALT